MRYICERPTLFAIDQIAGKDDLAACGIAYKLMHAMHEVPKWVKYTALVVMLIGLFFAWLAYIRRTDLPRQTAEQLGPIYKFVFNKWYFDELYNLIFVKPAFWLGRFFWKKGDGKTIDGFLNGVAMGIVPFFTRLAGRAQSGYIFTYAFWMVLGIAALVTWMSIGGGSH